MKAIQINLNEEEIGKARHSDNLNIDFKKPSPPSRPLRDT